MHGNHSANLLLQSVPDREWKLLGPKTKQIDLPLHTVLTKTGQAVKYAYFSTAGVASVLMVMPGGKSVEVGLTGKESFVGLPLLVGFRSSPTQALVSSDPSADIMQAKSGPRKLCRVRPGHVLLQLLDGGLLSGDDPVH
jgi:hypothetical protein